MDALHIKRRFAAWGIGAILALSTPMGPASQAYDTDEQGGGGWFIVGGTSSGTPQWAAIVAIADQLNGTPLGYINPALYKIGSDPARYASDFFDVTVGPRLGRRG
jgi:hypothetical protein